jgi:NB-ARC domain
MQIVKHQFIIHQFIMANESKNLRERVVAELSEASQASGGFNSYPIYRTTNFVGREKCMIDLRNMLLKDSSLSKCVVVHALGGQGKSRLASEYCHRSAGSLYHTILWVDASSVNSIQQSFLTFFNKVIPPANWPQISGDEKMASVLGYFERMRKPWLIVFDNYDCPDSILLQSFMPTNTAGSIIITSRHAQVTGWQTSQGVIKLGPLDQAAANRLFIESSGAEPSCENKAEIDKIVRLLSNHALAIHQAGKLWSRTKQPLSQFSEFYTNQKQKILSTTLSEVEYNRRLSEESQSLDVFATWELSVAQLGGDQTIKGMKEDMLTILGFWERQTVSEEPFKVFCNQIQAWDTPENMLQSPGRFIAAQLGHWGHELFFKYISELSDLGLITGYWLDDGFYRVSFHPLVRDWVRLRLPTSIAQEYRILAVEIMTEMLYITKWMSGTVSIPSDSDWSEYMALFDESDRKILTTYLDVESNLARALRESGDCGRSLKFSERLLSVMTRVLGAESKQRIEAEFNMCLSMIAAAADAADFANAEKRLRSLQVLSSSLYEPQDQVVRSIRTQISLCRMKVHDVGGAEILLKEQLLDDQRYFGDQSRNIWELKSLLATVLLHQNKFDEAGILFLEVKTQTSDLNPQFQGSWFRTFLWEYGTFLRLKRDFAASEEPLRQSWMGMLNHDGADHPNTTACLSSLLETTFKLHKFHVAEILAKDLIIAYSRRLGPNDWNIVHVKAILIHCLQGQMKTEEARALFREIVTSDITDRRADGQDQPPSCIDSFVTMGDVAILCREYSIRSRDLGLLQKAEDLTRRVLRGLIQLASKEDSRTKQMQLELNYIQQLKGQFSAGRR